jgi:hypothetical protein
VNAISAPPPLFLNGGAKPARVSRAAATALAVILVAAIGWLDYVTGDFSLTVFYLVPVCFATWIASRITGWSVGLLSAAAWLAGDLALNHSSRHSLLPY